MRRLVAGATLALLLMAGIPAQAEEPHRYRVVAALPRYRGDEFLGPDNLACHGLLNPVDPEPWWQVECADHVDRGELRDDTYVRLRDLTDGSVAVLFDFREE
jgi:hypothetical protein